MNASPVEAYFVCTVTLAEIRFGIERQVDPERRANLADWLANEVRPAFDGRILQVSEDIMLRWRQLLETGRKRGYTFSQPDLLIAAAALQHGLLVATRNTRDFIEAGVDTHNPWLD